jgi:hypothetical protein
VHDGVYGKALKERLQITRIADIGQNKFCTGRKSLLMALLEVVQDDDAVSCS